MRNTLAGLFCLFLAACSGEEHTVVVEDDLAHHDNWDVVEPVNVDAPAQGTPAFTIPIPIPRPNPPASTALTDAELAMLVHEEHRGLLSKAQSYVHYEGSLKTAKACDGNPLCNAGCALAAGYSLGPKTAKQVKADLTPILGTKRAGIFASLAGKTGTAAHKLCGGKLGKNYPAIKKAESKKLVQHVAVAFKTAILKRAMREGVSLSERQTLALTSLAWNCWQCVVTARSLWAHLKKGDHDAVAAEIKLRSGTSHMPELTDRRKREAALYMSAFTSQRHEDPFKVIKGL